MTENMECAKKQNKTDKLSKEAIVPPLLKCSNEKLNI